MSSCEATIETLKGFRSFGKVLTNGICFEKRPIRAYVCTGKAKKGKVLIGFSTIRGINKAVKRNEIKRQMREAFRINKDKLISGISNGVKLEVVFLYADDLYLKNKKKRFNAILNAMDHICSSIRVVLG